MTTLELELVELKARVERLEERVRRLAGDGQEVEPPEPGEPLDQEQLLAWLKRRVSPRTIPSITSHRKTPLRALRDQS